jgi:hypothetical protein
MSLDDRLKRGLPRLAAETDPDVEPALQRVVSGGRRRKVMYRSGAALAAAAVVAGALFATPRVLDALRGEPAARPGGTATEAPPETGETATPTAGETGMQTDSGWAIAGPLTCYEDGFGDTDLKFSPGYLPDGFSPEAVPGPAPGGFPAEEGQVVVHWTDGQGNSFEARNPGTLFVELAQEDDAPTITVLGEETPDFGPLAPMTHDYIVQFTYNPGGLPDNVEGPADCGLWSLNEYGLSLGELKKVAEGLVPA